MNEHMITCVCMQEGRKEVRKEGRKEGRKKKHGNDCKPEWIHG
jgi:hypothetical protein